ARTVHARKAPIGEHLPIFVAPHLYMNVRYNSHTHSFIQRTETPIWKRTRNLLRPYRANDLAVNTEDVDSAVKVIAAIAGVETATHFTHGSHNFVWTLLRVDWPRQRRLSERFVCQSRQRIDERRSR